MIIVSQDKKKIINFERITEIVASGTKILVRDDIFLPEGEEIAKYETEERAKEVLQEITRQYENSMWKLGRTTISFQDEFVYRMPRTSL